MECCKMKKQLMNIFMGKKDGQGVIEYAGAMIVAALIVSAVLVIGQGGMGTVYNTLFSGVQNFFTTQGGNL
jgi:Flp pilus assembly pilin Flp